MAQRKIEKRDLSLQGQLLLPGFVSGSSMVVDDTGTVAESEEVWFWPTGGDDGAALTARIAAGARHVRLFPLAYTVASPIVPLNDTWIEGYRNATVINSTMPASGSGSHPNSMFRQEPTFSAGQTTLTANGVVGSRTVSVASVTTPTIAIGSVILIQNDTTGGDQHGQYYTVKNVSGAGPYTLTLDRECLYAWNSATAFVAKCTFRPTNIKISNLRLTGSGDRAVELTGTKDCRVEHVATDGSFASIHMSFDVGGYNNVFYDCSATSNGGGVEGLALESNEHSIMDHCQAHDFITAGYHGIGMWNSLACKVLHPIVYHCAYGIALMAGPSTFVDGSINCSVEDATITACSTAGIYNQATGTVLKGIYTSACTYGILNDALSVGLEVYGFRGQGNTNDVGTNRGITITGFRSTGALTCWLTDAVNASGEPISVTDFNVTSVATNNISGFIMQGANGKLVLTRGTFTITGATPRYGVFLDTGKSISCWLNNVTGVLPSGIGIAVASGGTATHYHNQADLSGCGTQTFGGTKKVATYA